MWYTIVPVLFRNQVQRIGIRRCGQTSVATSARSDVKNALADDVPLFDDLYKRLRLGGSIPLNQEELVTFAKLSLRLSRETEFHAVSVRWLQWTRNSSLDRLTLHQLLTLLRSLGAMRYTPKSDLLSKIEDRFLAKKRNGKRSIVHLAPHELISVLFNFSKLGHAPGQNFWRHFRLQCIMNMRYLYANDLSKLAYSLAHLKAGHQSYFKGNLRKNFMQRTCILLARNRFYPFGMAQLLRGLSIMEPKLNVTTVQTEVVQFWPLFFSCSQQLLGKFRLSDLVITLVALSHIDQPIASDWLAHCLNCAVSLMKSSATSSTQLTPELSASILIAVGNLRTRIQEKSASSELNQATVSFLTTWTEGCHVDSFTPAELCTCLEALTQLRNTGYDLSSELLEQFLKALSEKSLELSTEQLAACITYLVDLNCTPTKMLWLNWYERFSVAADATPSDLRRIAAVLAKLAVVPNEDFWTVFCRALVARLDHASSHDVASIAHSMSLLGQRLSDIVWLFLLQKMPDFSRSELVNLCESLMLVHQTQSSTWNQSLMQSVQTALKDYLRLQKVDDYLPHERVHLQAYRFLFGDDVLPLALKKVMSTKPWLDCLRSIKSEFSRDKLVLQQSIYKACYRSSKARKLDLDIIMDLFVSEIASKVDVAVINNNKRKQRPVKIACLLHDQSIFRCAPLGERTESLTTTAELHTKLLERAGFTVVRLSVVSTQDASLEVKNLFASIR